MAIGVGTAATFTFGTTAIAVLIKSIETTGVSREAIEVTHLSTVGGKTFIPATLYDPGEISIEGFGDPAFLDDFVTKISAVAETCTVTFPGAQTLAASGFATEWEFGVPLEEEMSFSMTLKLSDEITASG